MLFICSRGSAALSIVALRRIAVRTLSSSRSTVIYAQDENRKQFYSVDDIERNDRAFPPMLDSQSEDEGFGAYDYEPDSELEEMKREESLREEFFGNSSSEENEEIQQVAVSDVTNNSEAPVLFESIENTYSSEPGDETRRPKEPPFPTTHFHAAQTNRETAPDLNDFLAKAASGTGATSTLDVLEDQLEKLTKEIYQENCGAEFNINSPAQVSRVLFGPEGGSTEKTILEGKAASGNRMASLVLQYRALRQQIRRVKRKQENLEKGTHVRSPSAVARESREDATDPLMLVDASSYIFRAYYSMPPIHRNDGMPTGAVLGFCNMLNRLTLNALINGKTPRLVLVFDAKGKTFRHDLYKDYKGNRPEAPMDLIPQFQLVRDAAKAYGICPIEAPTFEADDVISTLAMMAQKEAIDVNIFSGDKDLMQLVTDKEAEPSIHMIDPASMSRVTYDEVVEKWGIPPSQLRDVLALAGDSADNIPGVPGIGPKIAAQLVQEFGSLDNLLENTDKVKQKGRRDKLNEFGDQARLSRELVELDREVPFHMMTFPEGVEHVSDLRMEPLDEERILAFYDAMGFQDIKRRFQNSLQRGKPKRRPIRKQRPKATIPNPEDFLDVPF